MRWDGRCVAVRDIMQSIRLRRCCRQRPGRRLFVRRACRPRRRCRRATRRWWRNRDGDADEAGARRAWNHGSTPSSAPGSVRLPTPTSLPGSGSDGPARPLRRVRPVPRERRRVRPPFDDDASAGRPPRARRPPPRPIAERAGVGQGSRRPCCSTAAARTPTPGTRWRWRSAGRWSRSTCRARPSMGPRRLGVRRRRPTPTTSPRPSRRLAPEAAATVGMPRRASRRCDRRPPAGVVRRHSSSTSLPPSRAQRRDPDFIDGRARFDTFDEMLACTMEFNPPDRQRRCAAAASTTPWS